MKTFVKAAFALLSKFCEDCLHVYPHYPDVTGIQCHCETDETNEKKKKPCRQCHQSKCTCPCKGCGLSKCECPAQCKICHVVFKRGYNRDAGEGHRCIFYDLCEPIPAIKKNETEKGYKLFAYDIESAIKRHSTIMEVKYQLAGDKYATTPRGYPIEMITDVGVAVHTVNMVVVQNVFDLNEKMIFRGEDALTEFIMHMRLTNEGNNICVAHNGSGYDTRLVFAGLQDMELPNKHLKTILRGTKYMYLAIGKTRFQDSLLHLPGALSRLAKDFLRGTNVEMEKGYFPHLFNSEENYDYHDIIPNRKYFDMIGMTRSASELAEFDKWYRQRALTPWNFKIELLKYCENDVLILATIMRLYHETLMELYPDEGSPWLKVTGPAYAHSLIKRTLSRQLELDHSKEPAELQADVEELARSKHWAVLQPEEYWLTRKMLRGGKTDVRQMVRHITDEEAARGVKIMYQDVVSLYPYVQTCDKLKYPVGYPYIQCWDASVYPCYKHKNPKKGNNYDFGDCTCNWLIKEQKVNKLLHVNPGTEVPPSAEDFLTRPELFGIVVVSMTPPPHLFHPVTVHWDSEAGKCVASLQPLIKQVLGTPELIRCLQFGYTLDRLHRFDQYHYKTSLWADELKKLYLLKMMNSEPTPNEETQQKLVDEYRGRFGDDMAEQIQLSFPSWEHNPAKRQVYKIILNCLWGKHCQRIFMKKTHVVSDCDDETVAQLYTDRAEGRSEFASIIPVGDNRVMFTTTANNEFVKANFHDSYLPAGAFVPMYGRLMLHEQLSQLGNRVLYHDTDSIIYVYDPLLYNIPEGDVWGDWSVEKIASPKHGGIRSFVGVGPKSYGLRTFDNTELIKFKGVSLRHAHRDMMNFDKMVAMVEQQVVVHLPQMRFEFVKHNMMITNYFLKECKYQPAMLKGFLGNEMRLFPHGYCEAHAQGQPCEHN